MSISCPLCLSQHYIHFSSDKRREYLQCKICALVYVEDRFILSPKEEKEIYDLHENDINDSGYIKFLSRLTEPLTKMIAPGCHGLDFGCGPGPALAHMLVEQGFKMDLYDLYYFPDKEILKQKFDFITSTEVIEHIKDSKAFIDQLYCMLKNRGVIGIMTKLVLNQEAFSSWHYKNDQTHIRFFSTETFEWIAREWKMNIQFHGNDVILFEK